MPSASGGSGLMSWKACEPAWRRGWRCTISVSGSTSNLVVLGWLSLICWSGDLNSHQAFKASCTNRLPCIPPPSSLRRRPRGRGPWRRSEDGHRAVVGLAMSSANAPALKSIAAKLRANYGRHSSSEKDSRQIKYRSTGKDKEHLRNRLREGGEWQCEAITTASREREDTLYIASARMPSTTSGTIASSPCLRLTRGRSSSLPCGTHPMNR